MHMGAQARRGAWDGSPGRGKRAWDNQGPGRTPRRMIGLGDVEQDLVDTAAGDDVLQGLAGARFIYKGTTYMVEGNDIYSLQGYTIADEGELSALAMSGLFKKIGRLVTKPLRDTKRVMKTKGFKKVIKVVGVAAAVVGVAYGGWALYAAYGAKAAAGAASLGKGLLGKRGGASQGQNPFGDQTAPGVDTSGGGGGWSSTIRDVASAAGTAFDVAGKIGGAAVSMREQQQAADAAQAYATAQRSGGGGRNGGMSSDFAPDGYPAGTADNSKPGEMYDGGVPDVSNFSTSMAGIGPVMLILGGGLLLTAFMKRGR